MADLNLPFIANSDFHKPRHIYSWKTLIHAAKDAEAIKDCIRRNEHVAITLYRDFPVPLRLERGEESKVRCRNQGHGFADAHQPAAINSQPSGSSNLPYFQDRLPLRVVSH